MFIEEKQTKMHHKVTTDIEGTWRFRGIQYRLEGRVSESSRMVEGGTVYQVNRLDEKIEEQKKMKKKATNLLSLLSVTGSEKQNEEKNEANMIAKRKEETELLLEKNNRRLQQVFVSPVSMKVGSSFQSIEVNWDWKYMGSLAAHRSAMMMLPSSSSLMLTIPKRYEDSDGRIHSSVYDEVFIHHHQNSKNNNNKISSGEFGGAVPNQTMESVLHGRPLKNKGTAPCVMFRAAASCPSLIAVYTTSSSSSSSSFSKTKKAEGEEEMSGNIFADIGVNTSSDASTSTTNCCISPLELRKELQRVRQVCQHVMQLDNVEKSEKEETESTGGKKLNTGNEEEEAVMGIHPLVKEVLLPHLQTSDHFAVPPVTSAPSHLPATMNNGPSITATYTEDAITEKDVKNGGKLSPLSVTPPNTLLLEQQQNHIRQQTTTTTEISKSEFFNKLENQDFITHWCQDGPYDNDTWKGIEANAMERLTSEEMKLVLLPTNVQGIAQIQTKKVTALMVYVELLSEEQKKNLMNENSSDDTEEEKEEKGKKDERTKKKEESTGITNSKKNKKESEQEPPPCFLLDEFILPVREVHHYPTIQGTFQDEQHAAKALYAFLMKWKRDDEEGWVV